MRVNSVPVVVSVSTAEENALKVKALNIRKKIIRMISASRSGHVGGALSSTDILTALYFNVMRIDPNNPKWPERDRFVLSAGHKCLALYATLAEKGFIPEELLDTYGSLNSKMPGHPDMHKIPGIETNTGALGHGLSIAVGMAIGLRMDKLDSKVYVVMGDGELAEGSNWEAAAAAGHHKVDNLLAFIDYNTLQISGRTMEVMDYEPLKQKWEAFGWGVLEIDGHNFNQIVSKARSIPFGKDKPSMIIARTVKSKGLSFAEDKVNYHHWKPTDEELDKARADLDRIGEELNHE